MIKMTIGGEEVVCNKEFIIKEEMLSTSSTILNNCYPKSWEETKDYVSNFYYPKDYSKCLIYDKDDEIYQNYQILGNCIQEGTPTPDNPIPIETITGNITQNINNKKYKFSLGNIELCKIGNYQDYIYYNNGWYLHKEVEKIILIGTESWERVGTNTTNKYRFQVSNIIDNTTTDRNQKANFLCNMFNSISANDTYRRTEGISSRNPNVLGVYLYYENVSEYSLNDFKTWLSNNNIILYYALSEPTDTLITDQNLLNQLNFVGNELLFAGMVKNSGNISLNPKYPKYCALEILDFKDFLSTGETLDFVINEKTVQEAIEMVVNAVGQYGFVLGNINILNPNDVIGAYSTQNKSAYDVLQYLADISQSRWSTRMIDENTIAIDFYDPTLMPSGIDIDYTKEWWCQNKVIDLTWNYGTRDYRNKQVMLSDKVFAGTDYNETIIGDGYSTSFMITSEIGLMKSILVNGELVSFATNEDKEIGIDAEFYYTPGENTITTDNSYPSGTQIVVTYTPLVKGREVIYNTDEVNRINLNTGRKGVIARYEQRNDVLSSDELEMIGQTYLKYKGSVEIILTLQTQEDIYNIGQTVYFNAPIQELATSYMVKKKSTKIIATTNTVFYTYELTSSFNSETAINWFDNQRNKATGNISEGEYITRNYDIENTANIIWDNLTITEVNVTGTNVLNAPLNSPFVE